MAEEEKGCGLYRHDAVKSAMSDTSRTEGSSDMVIFRTLEHYTYRVL